MSVDELEREEEQTAPATRWQRLATGVDTLVTGELREEWFKQTVFLALGGAVYIVVSLIDYRFWLSVAHWVYLACLIPLFVVLVPGIGGGS